MLPCSPSNGTTPSTCWDGTDIVFDTGSATGSRKVRTYFTAAFTVLHIAMPFIGSFVIQKINQVAVSRRYKAGGGIPLSHMSPWLSTASAAWSWFRTRRMPGGTFGIAMIVLGLSPILSTFLVSYFIWDSTLPGSCNFTMGVVVSQDNAAVWKSPTPLPSDFFPTPLWPGSQVSLNSQRTSFLNRQSVGLRPTMGISSVANTAPNFFARDEDFLGQWVCTPDPGLSNNLIFTNNVTSTTVGTLFSQLTDRQLLFNNSVLTNPASLLQIAASDGGAFDNFVGLTPSSGPLWVVKSVMVSKLPSNTNTTSFAFTDLYCNLVSNPSIPSSNATLDLVLSNTNASAALANWGPSILGAVINISQGNVTGYSQVLEQYLNAMVMSWGSNNNANQVAPTYGCALTRVATSIGVWILLIIEAVLVLMLTIVNLSTLAVLKRNKLVWEKIRDMPSDLIDTQQAFFRHLAGDKQRSINEKSLTRYYYGWDESRDMLLFTEGGSGSEGLGNGHHQYAHDEKPQPHV